MQKLVFIVTAMAVAALSSVSASAQETKNNGADQPWFVDQRRLPDAQNTSPELDESQRKADEQKRALDEMAARLKAEELRLNLKEQEAAKKAEELRQAQQEAEAKHQAEEQRLLAKQTEAEKKSQDLQRAAAEAEAKRKAEEQRLSATVKEAEQKAEELKRAADQAVAKRQALEDETRRQELEAQKKAAETERQAEAAEAKRLAGEAEARKKFEADKRLADDTLKKTEDERRAAEDAAERAKAAQEKKIADQAEAKRKTDEQQRLAARQAEAAAAGQENGKEKPDSTGAATKEARVNVPAIALECPDPKISEKAVSGGLSSVVIQSVCRTGQSVNLRYGPVTIKREFDARGNAEFIVDKFLGVETETVVSFADGMTRPVALSPGDLGGVTKIAILWDAPVNLDLHAFEYAAALREAGHVWSGAPRDSAAATALIARDGRGHGFLSRLDDAKTEGLKAEVFTFVKGKQLNKGTVALSIDFETRGDKPMGETCGGGQHATFNIEIIVRDFSGTIRRQSGLMPAAACGKPLAAPARYRTGVVPDIRTQN